MMKILWFLQKACGNLIINFAWPKVAIEILNHNSLETIKGTLNEPSE